MYGECNDYVCITSTIHPHLEVLTPSQNLMHTGDPGQLVETGKQGMIFVDR